MTATRATFGDLPARAQPPVEGGQHGVSPRYGQRAHVEQARPKARPP